MWKTKSKDETYTVKVHTIWGRETGLARYIHRDGSKKTVKYRPRKFSVKAWELSRAGLLTGGFLVGLLLEWFTRVLK